MCADRELPDMRKVCSSFAVGAIHAPQSTSRRCYDTSPCHSTRSQCASHRSVLPLFNHATPCAVQAYNVCAAKVPRKTRNREYVSMPDPWGVLVLYGSVWSILLLECVGRVCMSLYERVRHILLYLHTHSYRTLHSTGKGWRCM